MTDTFYDFVMQRSVADERIGRVAAYMQGDRPRLRKIISRKDLMRYVHGACRWSGALGAATDLWLEYERASGVVASGKRQWWEPADLKSPKSVRAMQRR